MATKTITIDTNEWAYPDMTGVTHMVTNGQTFTFELTDNGAQDVVYRINKGAKLTTTDGLAIYPQASANEEGLIITGDAQEGAVKYRNNGEIRIKCPVTGIIQVWHPETLNIDNADAPTAISGVFADQYQNKFSWTTVTVS